MYPIPHHRPLLCELHAHTTWSDGTLGVTELVDLYGRTGFDVLCVSDHVLSAVGSADPERRHVAAADFPAYLAEIEAEAERAMAEHGLLLIPGAELTADDDGPDLAAHAVAVGLRSFVGLDDGLETALCRARANGAALIAAHPHGLVDDPIPSRTTRRFFRERSELGVLVDRHELFNRDTLFGLSLIHI